jgi:hypothetical protein
LMNTYKQTLLHPPSILPSLLLSLLGRPHRPRARPPLPSFQGPPRNP